MGLLNPITAFIHGAHVDAQFRGTGGPLPPSVILDYIYGVAAYKCWGSRPGHGLVESYYRENYANIPSPHGPLSGEDDDRNDPNCLPPTSPQQRCYTPTRTGDIMVKAMDELNLVSMHLQGTKKRSLTASEGRNK
ncbi:hypothetical protein EDB83DRAFT_1359922 [Lactarius deliciosus]|nr:hypothetical protein EDB83DRAFT_1359922 [Lactarius deliciosus]